MVSEIPGNWVDEIGPDGQAACSPCRRPVSYPSDPQPLPGGRILLADYASPGHVLIMDHAGKVLWRYGPTPGLRARWTIPRSRCRCRTGTSRSTTTTATAWS